MEGNRIIGLMKIGSPEHMEKLFLEGEIYMREVAYFKELEGDNQRADEHEGIFMQQQTTQLILKDEEGNEWNLQGHGVVRGYHDLRANIYCIYAFTTDLCAKTKTVDKDNYEFGSSFVLIYNVEVFIERVLSALRNQGFDPYWNLVEYYDESDRDDLTIFHKSNKYEHQSELRFFVDNPDGGAIKFNIGSLEDIAQLHETNILSKMTFESLEPSRVIMFNFY